MRRNRPEDATQRQVCAFLDLALPEDAVWFAIPNGGWRSKTEAAIMKGLGIKPGVLDLCIVWQGQAHFIELKPPKGRLSKAQVDMFWNLEGAGALCVVCRSLDEVIAWLSAAGIPLRARAA